MHPIDRVAAEVDRAADEIVRFTTDLVRIPTVNPPGAEYERCARFVGDWLAEHDYEVEYVVAEDRPEHSREFPRINVIGTRRGTRPGPGIHFNGHIDVVPAGDGWTLDPFAGAVHDGRIFGRGVCDMKAGLAAAMFAAEAVRRAGVDLPGVLEVSGTVDEESGGLAGVAHLCKTRRIRRDRTHFVIIPEPLNVDRICIGHRGVYWSELTTKGRIAHGSMPFLGVSAIEAMADVLTAIKRELKPRLDRRMTAMPVVPDQARRATINVNALAGGQEIDGVQTPCVADRCRVVFDRRFLMEEGIQRAKDELAELIARNLEGASGIEYSLRDLMIVEPVKTPDGSAVIGTLNTAIQRVLGAEATLVASPGTYDQKHFTRIGGIADCVAYGPGRIELAHQPDEWCAIADLVNATKVMALAMLELAEVAR